MYTTISLAEFCSLRAGDLVVWRGKYLRTVAKGPADMVGAHHPAVDFPIRRRSWRARIDTTYYYSDVKDKIRVMSRRIRGLMLPSEWKALEDAGFDVRRELRRELKYKLEESERTGRTLCKAFPRLEGMIQRAVRER